uniref:CGI-like protein n=1 Tax=Zea mays TaxID=4577 RepID=A0A804NVK7_MAIZE
MTWNSSSRTTALCECSTVRRPVADFLEREEEGIPHGRRRREQMGEGRDVGVPVEPNPTAGRLQLKGKALDVKDGGVKKNKKKYQREESSQTKSDKNGDEKNPHSDYDHLTRAERRYMEQKQKIDMKKMAKVANKSYKDRMQDFNQYLANLSEHYDIPKVGPG